MNETGDTNHGSGSVPAASSLLPDAVAMTRAMFGRLAQHIPMWMIVQNSGETTTFVGASRDPALRYGSRLTHQMIVGELIVRPHFVIESDQFRGHGLTSLLKDGANLADWLAGGQLVCDPIGRFQDSRRWR